MLQSGTLCTRLCIVCGIGFKVKGFVCILVFLKSNGFQKRNWETFLFFFLIAIKPQEVLFLPFAPPTWSTVLCSGSVWSSASSLRFSYPSQSDWTRFPLPVPPLELNTPSLEHPTGVKMSEVECPRKAAH